ncbi:MFS transporter [Streptomyces profundus]|uniref:MFS transporter n=1 Tax=Streptomyces profundus TaxID=2867410 RepID=UPI001D165D5D|nr:MFS transporter [Streptomyces sp. MA3_2.13]UED87789.1 MFS transporter [Streptomyces sp. MA3_2.13]
MPTESTSTSPEREQAPPEPEKSLFRNRDFQAMWISQFFAAVAKESAEIAYPLLILATTGSATYAGAVGAIQLVVAGLMSLPGGSVSDRFDRRTTMIVCDVARVAMLALFGFLVMAGDPPMVVIFAIVIVSAGCLGISNPAGLAAIKQLVPPSQFTQATAQNQIRFFGATVIGPPIGGTLFGIARALPFLSAAIAFLISAVLLLFIRKPMQAPRPAQPPAGADLTPDTGKGGMLQGFKFIGGQPIILILIIWAMGSNMAFNHSGVFLALIATAEFRGASEATIGTTLAVAGSGGLIGSLLAGLVLKWVRPSVVMHYAIWVGPVCAVLLMLVPGVLPLGVIVACIFLRAGVVNALIYSYIAALVPDDLQGRVLGAVGFLGMIAQPLGIFGIGALFDLAGPTWVFFAMAVAGTLAALPTLTKTIRKLPAPHELAS